MLIVDLLILFFMQGGVEATRRTPERFSNGDDNQITITVTNRYPFNVDVEVIDELPIQLQVRNFNRFLQLSRSETKAFSYILRPVERGEYHFGDVILLAQSRLGLLRRRFASPISNMVPVYPSFIQMRKYEMLAISNRLSEAGIKRIRRVGHTMEFDQIREYVPGDDIRTINWQATARKVNLMVNSYEDERSQQIYSIINMGRVMKMPFNGLSLLDYSINAALVISNVAMRKQDKAGIVTYSHKLHSLLKAQRHASQMSKILELLYRERTDFTESHYASLYLNVRKSLHQRSLLLLFTNFQTLTGLRRELSSLKRLAKHHVLVVIFFEDVETESIIRQKGHATEDIYFKTIARQFAYEKRQIAKELRQNGIHSILTAPENLTVNTINTYLALKSRGII